MMRDRDWFVLSLRVFGFSAALGAIRELSSLAIAVRLLTGKNIVYAGDFFTHAFGTVTYGAVAVLLLLQAPWISSKFYPEVPSDNPTQSGTWFTLTVAYEIGLRILGVYALLFVLAPLSQAALTMNRIDWSDGAVREQVWFLLIQAAAFGVSGVVLVFLAPQIARLFAGGDGNR